MSKGFCASELSSRLLATETRYRSELTCGQDVGYYLMNAFLFGLFSFGAIECLRLIYQ
jgi:hypothetical protein